MAKKTQKKARNGNYAPQPVTRWQKFWAALAGVIQNHPDPNTEDEYWLAKTADRIAAIEEGGGGGGNTEIYYTTDLWTIWKDNNTNTFIASKYLSIEATIEEASGVLYKSQPLTIPYPEEVRYIVDLETLFCSVNVRHNNYTVFATDVFNYNEDEENLVEYRITSGGSKALNRNYGVDVLLIFHLV